MNPIFDILLRHFDLLSQLKNIWLSNHLNLTVTDIGYSKYGSCALNLISTFD